MLAIMQREGALRRSSRHTGAAEAYRRFNVTTMTLRGFRKLWQKRLTSAGTSAADH